MLKTSHANCAGCNEYHSVTRRKFLGTTGTAAAVMLSAPVWLPRVAYAQSETTGRDVVISVFLRGGCDGLSVCVPHGENAYYNARPNISIARPDTSDPLKATDLDGFFGLPPAMTPLLNAYNAGHFLIVHACGQTDDTRSHFDAMQFMEVGKPRDPAVFTGWLGRHLQTSAPTDPNALLRAVAINDTLQRTLAGAPLALPIPDPGDFGLDGYSETRDERLDILERSYVDAQTALSATAENTVRTIDSLNAIDFENYIPGGGAVYPDTYFSYGMKSAAALIKAQIGVEAIAIDLGGWDTHADQQPRQGYMADLMGELAGGLAAFHADMTGGSGVDFTLVVMSEFGRMLVQNGTHGTDHGHGNIMLVMGNHISGGRVLADWPGLGPNQLFQGQDLDVTIDYRNVLAEIIQNRLGNGANLGTIFPDFTPVFPGVTI